MGEKLASYFNKVKETGGAVAQMKLAMLTQMSPQKAKAAADDADNVEVFEKAIEKLKSQGVIG